MKSIKIINHHKLIKLFIKVIIFLLSCTFIYMFFDYNHWIGIDKEKDKNLFTKFIDRLYFTSTTIATIGYGEIAPKSNITRIITIIIHIIIIVALIDFIQISFK